MNETSPAAVEIDVVEPSSNIPPESTLEAWAEAALRASAKDDKAVTFSLRIVGTDEMASLNEQFADKPRPTNVLSFAHSQQDDLAQWPEELADMLALDGGEAGLNSIGDIAICTDVVAREAKEQGKLLDAHWAHMLVHGILHLRGYDHTDETTAAVMESEEIRILASLGFSNPYITAEDGA